MNHKDGHKQKSAEKPLPGDLAAPGPGDKYQELMDNAGDAILLADLDGKILESNKKAEELFGYDKKEMIGKNVREIHPEKELERTLAVFKQISATGAGTLLDGKILRKDGGIVEVEINGGAINWGGKRLVQGIFRDLSQRRQMESALKESEQRFRTVFEAAEDHMFIKDLALKYTHANPAFAKSFKLRVSDLIGKTNIDIHGPEKARGLVENDLRTLKGETTEQEFKRVVDGIERFYDIIKVPLRDSTGKIAGLYGIARDITAHKRTEDALRQSESTLRLIADNMTDMISLVSQDLIIRYSSPSHKAVLGYEPEELIGKSAANFAHPDDLSVLWEEMNRASITRPVDLAYSSPGTRKSSGGGGSSSN